MYLPCIVYKNNSHLKKQTKKTNNLRPLKICTVMIFFLQKKDEHMTECTRALATSINLD